MKCQICKVRVSQLKCRRCGKPICSQCHVGHGLCRECARRLSRRT